MRRVEVRVALRGAQAGVAEEFLNRPEVGTPLKNIERRMIEETLRYCNGDKNLAASLMGITSRTIYRREAEWAEEDATDGP